MTRLFASRRSDRAAGDRAVPDEPTSSEGLAWQRSGTYQMLALLFGQEPTVALLGQLGDPDVAESLRACGVRYQDRLWQRTSEERLAELEVEYARLFIGPGPHIALQESVQRGEGQLWGAHTCEAVQWYARGGYEVDAAWTDLPDHLAVELQFLSCLARREAVCWQNGDVGQALALARLEHEFLTRHPMRWVPALTRQVAKRAVWAFYPSFAALLDRALAGDVATLQRLQP